MVEQQAELGAGVSGADRLQRGQVLEVQRDNMAEPAKIMGAHLPRAIGADVDAMTKRDCLSPPIRRLADMPVSGSGGIRFRLEPDPGDLDPEGGFGQRRAANIAEADEQDGGLGGHGLRSSVFGERCDRSRARAWTMLVSDNQSKIRVIGAGCFRVCSKKVD